MLNDHQLSVGGSGRYRQLMRTIALVAIVAVAATLLPFGARAQDPSADLVYFDGTGQTLGGAFYDGWVIQGGLDEAEECERNGELHALLVVGSLRPASKNFTARL